MDKVRHNLSHLAYTNVKSRYNVKITMHANKKITIHYELDNSIILIEDAKNFVL